MDGDKSEPSEIGLLGRALSAVTFALANRPKWTLFFVLLTCVVSLGWTAGSLRFKTDRSDLIDPQADFQKRWLRYTDRFGSTPDALVVAEASDPKRIPAGCRFHPRCPIAEPRCSTETPPLKPRPAGGVECLLVP